MVHARARETEARRLRPAERPASGPRQEFDPRPLRIAAVVAVVFLVAPGSFFGATMLWTLGGASAGVALPLVPASTHAMLQLAGGFMTLIQAFLAFGVPHLLGLDLARARRMLVPIVMVGVALAVDVVGTLAGAATLMTIARCAGCAFALAGAAVLVDARRATPRRSRMPLSTAPLPMLVSSLALYPLAWLMYALEPSGVVREGVAADTLLFLVVVPVVLSMGWKMFSAMLQLDAGRPAPFFAAGACWLGGGALVVLSRFWPVLSPFAAAPLLAGAVLWLASLRGLQRKRGGLALVATAGSELRVHVVVAAACLVLSPLLWLCAGVFENAALVDVARHVLAIGFVFVVTMGVTLRALPRFCRGPASSPRLALLTLALLLTGLALRTGRLAPDGGSFVHASAALTLAAVVVWGLHLLRGLRATATGSSA